MRNRILALCLFGVSTAHGGRKDDADEIEQMDPAVVEAEHQRLSEEMAQLARRQRWEGVERTFQECLEYGVDLTFEDLMHGARAARGLGNAQGVYKRLRQAARMRPAREVVDWLWDLDSTYGHVSLTSVPVRKADFEVEEMPFAPDQRRAVQYASRHIEEHGRFEGMLPKGRYRLNGKDFEVTPGMTLQMEVSARPRRQADEDDGEE